jgi:NADH dehydrogenase FAD-containing subunit
MNAQARGLVEAGPHLLDRAVVAAYGHTAVERVELDDGPTLDADADADADAVVVVVVVVVGIGITPSTGWLAGSGLSRDNGLLCTKYLHSVDTASVFATGDVARWHNPATAPCTALNTGPAPGSRLLSSSTTCPVIPSAHAPRCPTSGPTSSLC